MIATLTKGWAAVVAGVDRSNRDRVAADRWREIKVTREMVPPPSGQAHSLSVASFVGFMVGFLLACALLSWRGGPVGCL